MINSANIEIPYEFASSNVELSWADIKFGIGSNFLVENDAITHAVNELSKEESPSSDLESLAFLFKGEDIEPFLTNLSTLEHENENAIKEKWLYLLLKWIFEHKDSLYKNFLDVVEHVYADFDYPHIIAGLIKYMPNENTSKYNATGENLLLEVWGDYLRKQDILYNNRYKI